MSAVLRLVATLTLVLGACSTGSERADLTGSLALELQIADGVLIESVRWAITGGDMEPMSGAIDTSAPGSTASVEVLGIPPDDGYTVTLEATSTDGETTCAGSAQFDVEAREVNEVHIMLRCKQAPRFGGVRVNGKLNVCAELVKVVVSPLETSVGSAIDLSSQRCGKRASERLQTLRRRPPRTPAPSAAAIKSVWWSRMMDFNTA
ncbi:MAG: hypothetical protein JRF54_06240 [Deltaproteobacteria bacterium]|nr:hypothetical protein [Deltaproteobacteria bacterium]